MEAKDYPVTFPYGATTTPYSIAHPHTGEDRKMPLNTPIKVNGVLVGYAGTTGKSTGVHTHTQKVYGNSVVHPQGGGFEVPRPCIVTETGYKKDSIGYYVRYRDGNGFIWSIFHMDKPSTVRVGQQLIKGEDMNVTPNLNNGDVINMWQMLLGKAPSQSDLDYWKKNPNWHDFMYDMQNRPDFLDFGEWTKKVSNASNTEYVKVNDLYIKKG